MKFELERFNRNVPDEELIADLQRVASEHGLPLTMRQYDKLGQFSCSRLGARLGGWSNALIKAGLAPNPTLIVTDAELLEDLRNVAQISESSLTARIYDQKGKYASRTVLNHFGKWNYALKEAGIADLIRNGQLRKRENALLENIESVWLHLGKQPRAKDINQPPSKYRAAAYQTFFGSWMSALEKFVSVANGSESEEDVVVVSPNEQQLIPSTKIPAHSLEDNKNYASPKRTNRDPNLRLRWQVYKRDNFRCVSCGRSPAKDPSVELHVDHIKPWSKGGETVLENLQTLCATCNLGKSNIE
jgi:5-methylcytosine-specific restriction endonuclease McrA